MIALMRATSQQLEHTFRCWSHGYKRLSVLSVQFTNFLFNILFSSPSKFNGEMMLIKKSNKPKHVLIDFHIAQRNMQWMEQRRQSIYWILSVCSRELCHFHDRWHSRYGVFWLYSTVSALGLLFCILLVKLQQYHQKVSKNYNIITKKYQKQQISHKMVQLSFAIPFKQLWNEFIFSSRKLHFVQFSQVFFCVWVYMSKASNLQIIAGLSTNCLISENLVVSIWSG